MKKINLPLAFSYILSFFLSLTICAVAVCFVFLFTIANPENIDKAILKSDFVKPLKNEISEKWENLAAISGMEESEKLLALLSDERIEKDSREYFKKAYKGKAIDTTPLKDEIYVIVSEYAKAHNPHLISDSEVEQNVLDLVNACITEYDISVKIKLMPTLLAKVSKLTPVIIGVLIGCIVLSVGLFIFIFRLQKSLKNTLTYLFYALASNSILFVFLSLFIYFNNFINRIPIEASALYNLTVEYLTYVFSVFNTASITLCIISALILLLLIFKKEKSNSFQTVYPSLFII